MARQRRFLGELDAAKDQQFENHFVESLDVSRLNSSRSDIVYGAKGVGKTALRRALTELNQSLFYSTKTIDLNSISFSQVHDALSILKDTSKTEVPTLARNTWRNVLAMYCLETVADALPGLHQLRIRISKFLNEEDFSDGDSNNRLLSYIERIFLIIGRLGLEEESHFAPLGLTKKQRNVINAFPSHPEARLLLEECSVIVRESGKVCLVCLDGFDSIVDHTEESRKAIFAGLIDAIHKCSSDPLFMNAFSFKAFLPQELTDEAHAIVWDSDKFTQSTHHLSWAEEDFQRFVRKRLLTYSRTKSNKFWDVWHEFMPDKVRNEAHRIEESSFSYILRHTLFRPRHVLDHLQNILDRWDEISVSFRVDPTFIPPIVAKKNYELAKIVINQLELTHPGLGEFMQSWGGSSNVIFVNDFLVRLQRFMVCQSSQEASKLFDTLFNFGLFGIARKSKLARGSQLARFKFGFVGDVFEPNIHAAVDGADLVALSPMLREYCGCTPSEWGAIIPVSEL
jgi:hypothetical protein